MTEPFGALMITTFAFLGNSYGHQTYMHICCVFRPANGSSACRSLVTKTTFSVTNETKKQKNKRKPLKIMQNMRYKKGEIGFSIQKLILTSERRAEHPFAGRNTQHTSSIFVS